ncbi:MAG: LemA family protein [Abditibacteriaceae bacterium]
MQIFFVYLLLLFAAFFVWILFVYNALISGRNGIKNAEGGIDAQLQKRYDLIPNLVTTVKGYAAHEQSSLEQVTHLRRLAMQSDSVPQKNQANVEIDSSLKHIFAIAESYPDLKANENFLQLQAALNEVEEQLAAARRTYNATVTQYNNTVESFPSSMVANTFGFIPHHWFENTPEAQQNPQIVGKL